VTGRPRAQRIAEHLIRRACRHLPGDTRDERYQEWTAELPAILHDRDIRPALLRSAHALSYAIGIFRSTRHLGGTADISPRDTRQPAIFPRPDGVFPAIAAVALWFTLLALGTAFPSAFSSPSAWMPLVVAAAFAPGLLFVVAIGRFVLWLRRRPRRTPDP
jgi:hypothetical protein